MLPFSMFPYSMLTAPPEFTLHDSLASSNIEERKEFSNFPKVSQILFWNYFEKQFVENDFLDSKKMNENDKNDKIAIFVQL